MNGRRSDDHKAHGRQEQLLGNGTLTVAARLMSVAGIPLAAALLAFMANEIWTELKANRTERQAIMVTLGRYDQRFTEIDRRNEAQDTQLDRLRNRTTERR